MSRITLGKGAAGGAIALDLEVLIASRMLLQANSGAGKSWALRRLLEQTFGHVPHVVIDLEGEFHTLREKHAYVLAGGPGSDLKLELKVAQLLARRILEHGFNCIVDISELKVHERTAFVRRFLEALIEAPRNLRRPLLVVVDEAHVFCPEKGSAESAGAVIDLMSRGRKRGLCGVLATQRISKLNKDAAAEANNKIIGRAALDLDMKRAAEELGFSGKEEQHRLRNLDPGHFFAFGPALSRTVVEFTMGAVNTTHPEPGARLDVAQQPPPEKLKGILAKLADLPKEVDAEADELTRLRQRVAQLTRMYEDALHDISTINQKVEAQDLIKIKTEGRDEGFADAVDQVIEATADLKQWVGFLQKPFEVFMEDLEAMKAGKARPSVTRKSAPLPPALRRAPAASTPSSSPATPPRAPVHAGFDRARGRDRTVVARRDGDRMATTELTRPRQAILDALAWLESIGVTRGKRVTVALLAGQSPKSSGFDNNLGALRSTGLITYPNSAELDLTVAGRSVAQLPSPPPTVEDMHRVLREKLPAPRWRILEILIERYPHPVSRVHLAEQAKQSPTSSGYDNNLGALRALGFIDYPDRDSAVALPVLFLEK